MESEYLNEWKAETGFRNSLKCFFGQCFAIDVKVGQKSCKDDDQRKKVENNVSCFADK